MSPRNQHKLGTQSKQQHLEGTPEEIVGAYRIFSILPQRRVQNNKSARRRSHYETGLHEY
jgi:hypothetical protein